MFKLRNQFINTTAMFLAPPNEGEEDNRSEAQKQRDAISISDSTDDNKDDANKEGDDNNDAEKDDNEEDEDKTDDEDKDDEESDEDKEEDKDDKQETAEEKTARLAKEKESRREARVQKRIDKAVSAQKAAEERAEAAEKRLKETPVEGLTQEDVDRLADEKAAAKLAEKAEADAKKKWEDTCDALEADAIKANKDFPKAVSELTEELGPIPGAVISILSDLDNANGGEVLAYLASNVEEAEDLFELKSTPHKLAMKLTRLSDKLKEAKKTPRKERSALPPPIDPLGGNSRDTTIRITGKETQEEFNAKRARQTEERRKARGY